MKSTLIIAVMISLGANGALHAQSFDPIYNYRLKEQLNSLPEKQAVSIRNQLKLTDPETRITSVDYDGKGASFGYQKGTVYQAQYKDGQVRYFQINKTENSDAVSVHYDEKAPARTFDDPKFSMSVLGGNMDDKKTSAGTGLGFGGSLRLTDEYKTGDLTVAADGSGNMKSFGNESRARASLDAGVSADKKMEGDATVGLSGSITIGVNSEIKQFGPVTKVGESYYQRTEFSSNLSAGLSGGGEWGSKGFDGHMGPKVGGSAMDIEVNGKGNKLEVFTNKKRTTFDPFSEPEELEYLKQKQVNGSSNKFTIPDNIELKSLEIWKKYDHKKVSDTNFSDPFWGDESSSASKNNNTTRKNPLNDNSVYTSGTQKYDNSKLDGQIKQAYNSAQQTAQQKNSQLSQSVSNNMKMVNSSMDYASNEFERANQIAASKINQNASIGSGNDCPSIKCPGLEQKIKDLNNSLHKFSDKTFDNGFGGKVSMPVVTSGNVGMCDGLQKMIALTSTCPCEDVQQIREAFIKQYNHSCK